MIDVAHHSTPLPVGLLQLAVLTCIWLVAGSTFGIWRGYDPATWPAETFVTVHQGTVRGLNILLPVMGFATLLGTLVLAIRRSPKSRRAVVLRSGACLHRVCGGDYAFCQSADQRRHHAMGRERGAGCLGRYPRYLVEMACSPHGDHTLRRSPADRCSRP